MVIGEEAYPSRIPIDGIGQRANGHAQVHPYKNGSRLTGELQSTRARHAIECGKV